MSADLLFLENLEPRTVNGHFFFNRPIIFCLLIIPLFLTGCETISYYGQAIAGQMGILNKRKPIEKLLKDEGAPEKLKTRLRLVLDLRKFAAHELRLPVKDHYRSYVELNRPYVVWNVVAVPEFSLESKTWCYPIAGCAAYRGYFAEEDAKKYAAVLEAEGFDVYVGGVSAYSTLGWFDDPILSTFVDRSEPGLAGLIFHELGHQALYVAGDTAFNESFATVVEREGVRRWLALSENPGRFDVYFKKEKCYEGMVELIMRYGARLESLYRQDLKVEEKRRRKVEILKALKKEYEDQKTKLEGCGGYDSWFEGPINNARIASLSVYHHMVPAFQEILEQTGGDLEIFYERCKALAKKPETERHEELRRIMGSTNQGIFFSPQRRGGAEYVN